MFKVSLTFRYQKEMLKMIRSKPELITLFQMKNYLLKLIEKNGNIDKFLDNKIEYKDVGIQTVTHIHPCKIVPNYSSNVWDLRRRALKQV